MVLTRVTFALLAFCCLVGWLWLRKPYSPTDDLPAVAYTAFNVQAPDLNAGLSIAQAARGWQGVTASTYNPDSKLVVLSHTAKISERELLGRLQILSPNPVSKKVFPEPTGPKCPVPQAALAALPNWLLGFGIAFGLGFALLFTRKRTQTATTIPTQAIEYQ